MGMQELRMHYSAACVLVGFIIGGCMPQPVVEPQKPEPVVVKDYDTAAEIYVEQYKAGLSKAASEVAADAKAGKFSDMVDLNSSWTDRTKQARVAAQAVLVEKMNTVKDLEVNDPKVAEMFEKLAAGWSKKP